MRIRNKLFVVLLVSGLCLTVMLSLLARWSMDRGMLEYLNSREREIMSPVAAQLGEMYAEHGTWQFLEANPSLLFYLIRSSVLSSGEPPKFDREHRRRRLMPHDKLKAIVLDANKHIVLGPPRIRKDFSESGFSEKAFDLLPIVHDGETYGWLALRKRFRLNKGYEVAFIEKQYQALFMISGLVFLLALCIAVPLARHFLIPINKIASTVSRLRSGDYQKLDLIRNDELGALARDINELSDTLRQNKDVRDRWLADTSHELRTPISILKGEIEAMLEGIRPTGTENLLSLQQEVERLQKLVEDLTTLSYADIGALNYRKEETDLVGFLEHEVARHQAGFESANLRLQFSSACDELPVLIDAGRMKQLMDNLLSNSRKYTDAGGEVRVELDKKEKTAIIKVNDSSPSVPEGALPKLFEHLYRVEESRNRETGGSGLGLAICQRIVEGHQGKIYATHSSLGGLQITVELPENC